MDTRDVGFTFLPDRTAPFAADFVLEESVQRVSVELGWNRKLVVGPLELCTTTRARCTGLTGPPK